MGTMADPALRCTVAGAEALPGEIGGSEAVCAAIERAAAPAIKRAGISASSVAVAVAVKSPSRLSAIASVGERSLPEQHVGISDRPINARAIDMLARAVAAQIEQLGQ